MTTAHLLKVEAFNSVKLKVILAGIFVCQMSVQYLGLISSYLYGTNVQRVDRMLP